MATTLFIIATQSITKAASLQLQTQLMRRGYGAPLIKKAITERFAAEVNAATDLYFVGLSYTPSHAVVVAKCRRAIYITTDPVTVDVPTNVIQIIGSNMTLTETIAAFIVAPAHILKDDRCGYADRPVVILTKK